MINREHGSDAKDDTPGNGERDLDSLFRCLANSTRRRLLGVLYRQAPDAIPQDYLETHLIRGHDEGRREEGPAEAVQQVVQDLYHTHLPKLDAAGLIERNPTRGTIRISQHPAFEDPGIVDAISAEADADADSFDALFTALADSRRRAVLDVLSHQFGPIHRETLARELGAHERDIRESDVSAETVDRILISLHHLHLPQLSEPGLIEYDTDEQTVAYAGHPKLRVPWMHSVLEPEFRSSLTGEADPEGVGEIDGRENVVSFGQSLCDRADDELFCMFTDTNLLESGCFTRIRDAARRGVDVYLGTHDPTVQEYIRENAPEVVLWEPTTDWLNLPAAEGRVGRLLLADREAVMLGTLLEETTDGVHEEQALVGEGADNVLVTMVCQFLTPHLDRIDERGADVESQLPF